jgi:hypothetical protein
MASIKACLQFYNLSVILVTVLCFIGCFTDKTSRSLPFLELEGRPRLQEWIRLLK